ncbi:MAG: hypothetical protein HWD60_16680 [Defluviicoccus sp.]|nr:MAG: hypothetical protein HWD60_16680 [Defluviicoccus sp.]
MLSRFAADARAAGSRLVAALALVLVAALLATGGTAVLFVALYLWLATMLQPALAALLTALAVFVTALLLLLIGQRTTAPRARAPRLGVAAPPGAVSPGVVSPEARPAGIAAAVGSEIGMASAGWVRGHASEVVIAAAAAGFAVGVSPGCAGRSGGCSTERCMSAGIGGRDAHGPSQRAHRSCSICNRSRIRPTVCWMMSSRLAGRR